jgi:hypothetical protein
MNRYGGFGHSTRHTDRSFMPAGHRNYRATKSRIVARPRLAILEQFKYL